MENTKFYIMNIHYFYKRINFLIFKIKLHNPIGFAYITFLVLKGYFSFFVEFFFPLKKSLLPLDVIITVHPKDKLKIEDCLKGIKRNVLHNIKKIFLVGPYDEDLIYLSKKYFCEYINEEKILRKKNLNINYIFNGVDRSGWLYQQLLNYKAVTILGEENFKLAVDCDTVFSRRQRFEKNKRIVFNACDDFHKPYFNSLKKLLNLENKLNISFTSHHIVYNKSYLIEMLIFLEKKYKTIWYKAILDNLDYKNNTKSNHSEFETYAQYVIKNYRNKVQIEYWFNKTVFKENKKKIKDIFDCFFYKSLSFHSWND